MPLLIICGCPGSGKTTRSKELAQYISEIHKKPVQLINEEGLHIDKNQGYADSVNEKMTRGFIKSNVEKYISQDVVVIVDSMNYIKGYRYEMYCLARSSKTNNCTLYLNTPREKCREWNSLNPQGFNVPLFEDLVGRMETPKQKDRWDSPYFEVRWNEQTPMSEMVDILLYQDKKAKDPTATKMDKTVDPDFVQKCEQRMQDIVDRIMKTQNECVSQGISIRFDGTKEMIKLKRVLSLIELKKLRLEFSNLIRINSTITKIDHVTDGFICFLGAQVCRL